MDAVLEHGDALDAHAKREAGPFFRIVVDAREHRRVDHARAQNFQPAGLRTHPASFAATHDALNVHFRARAGERKKTGPEPHGRAFSKNLLHENIHDAFEVAEGNVAVDHEAFDLVKHRRVGDVGVAPVHFAGGDDA